MCISLFYPSKRPVFCKLCLLEVPVLRILTLLKYLKHSFFNSILGLCIISFTFLVHHSHNYTFISLFSCSANHYKVLFVIADSPERAFLRKQINHNGYFSCDVCTLQGARTNHVAHWPPFSNLVRRNKGMYKRLEDLLWILDNFDDISRARRYVCY